MSELALRQRVCEFWSANSDKGKHFTVKHFVDEGCRRSTIYSLLAKLDNGEDVSRKPGSGGHNKKLSQAQRASIGRWLKNKRGVSLRREAKKYGVSEATMRNVMRERGLHCCKRMKAPQYTDDQEKRAKVRAGKLLRLLGQRKILMDDEAYFKLKCDYLPGNDHYFTSSAHMTPLRM
jgi:transposase